MEAECPNLSIIRLHLSIVLTVIVWKGVDGDVVKCNIPSVDPMAETNLTCHFPEDVSKTKKDITVYFKDNNGSFDSVLEYFWVSGKVVSLVHSGYEFDSEITDSITLRIPRASERHTGRYSCHISGSRPSDIEHCFFELRRDGTVRCKIPAGEPAAEARLTCYFPEDVNQTQRNFEICQYTDQGGKATILKCRWRRGQLQCEARDGYVFDKVVTHETSLRIPHASDNHTGNYTCHLLDNNPRDIQHCRFSLLNFNKRSNTIPDKEKSSVTEGKIRVKTLVRSLLLPVLFAIALIGATYLTTSQTEKNLKIRRLEAKESKVMHETTSL